ncbi:MAG: aminotransferase class I/II-fold pyridoxal phosphate-dependent enzyme [Acidobacteria bacterium]|nr:aminotransferase class I/II-fold pyridoxal phosphate-dependent enzyme [Acidobacteriota bacterium]
MRIPPFELERFQSVHEHQVEINLTESGVEPLEVGELLGPDAIEGLLGQPLAYTQSNGTPELRAAVATTLPGATEEHVVVANGGAEANFVACWRLIDPGDEVVVMQPNYGQVQGLAEGFGALVRPWPLREERAAPSPRWAPDVDELRALVTDRTKLVAICNPNNPTGARLTGSEVAAVCEVAERHGAWVLSDEIYRGVEHDGVETPTVWGRTERAIVTGGLSKVYGLPGLRIGWAVAARDMAADLGSRRDYTTIAPSAVSDRLARHALAPARRTALLERSRRMIAANIGVVGAWVDAHAGDLAWVPPEAGAIGFVRYSHDIGSTALADRLRQTEGVLVVPGDHFGLDGYLRIGYGGRAASLREGLARLDRVLAALPQVAAPTPARA